LIRLERVKVSYGRTTALYPLDLEIGCGIVGLFGPNGAGKSTLLRVLAGLLRPSSGRLVIDGAEWGPRMPEELRGRVGYVGHASGLYGYLTVQENLELFATLHGRSRTRALDVQELLGLGPHSHTPVSDVSAGIKRRSAVARALVHEPSILLLDEPYANLDDDAAELVSNALVGWRSSERVAVIATHGAKRVKRFADAGVILQRGRVVSYRIRTELEAAR